ncbi:zinc-binding alcohol dehydrogenase [Paracoccus sp. NGMCC 1.201697]|uniref:Zinc-binding alcohol dehydrogenase n=1 Tax=Paracoccus broussonetiae subsp. drimophilus TaxID=3373869 RepID=A0ABW7LQL4_9RHOB
MTALALWWSAPGEARIQPAALGHGVLVETAFSGISRGTERLISQGRVPPDEALRMRAPFQEGDFPFPVKYGYAAVGQATEGAMAGRSVFALFPHQDRFRLPEAQLLPLPDAVPPGRAVLAANMETALNVLWDSGAAAGDRIAIFGAGLVGLLIGALATRLPGAEVVMIDPLPARRPLAEALGCTFCAPSNAPQDQDVAINCSASAEGLVGALAVAGMDATVVEASWHGDRPVALPLGATFHSRRLRLVSSQVGGLPPARAPRWSHGRRLAKAISLLDDPRLDLLISGETPFRQMPQAFPAILADPDTLCHRIRY